METIGNFAYAGTQKFVSHALTDDGEYTLCGMKVSELTNRRKQQWEYETSDSFGCLKCKHNAARHSKRKWNKGERPAINALRKLAKRWPKTIGIFSFSGALLIVDEQTNEVLENIEGIPNDGGDPGSIIDDEDREFLTI